MKRTALLLATILMMASSFNLFSKDYTLKSPDGQLVATISAGESLCWSVAKNGTLLITPSKISMTLANGVVLGAAPKVRSAKTISVSSVVPTPIYRQKEVLDEYNQLEIKFKDGYSVIWRAYNDGIAYRFCTSMKEELVITDELAQFNFADDHTCYIPYSANPEQQYQISFESRYDVSPISGFEKERIAFLPLLVAPESGVRIAIAESDLESYPGMFLTSKDACKDGLRAIFAHHPSEVYREPYRCQEMAVSYSDTMAVTVGTRSFPWRIVAIVANDTELPTNNLVWLLGSENRIGDISWIKSGKVAWDWWNHWGITGVDFPVGINTDTYKYFIDFASANGIEYVVLDEGWSKPSDGDIMNIRPELNLPEIVAYGKSKNVGIILWAVAYVLDDKLEEACKTYSEMGVVGFKVDFMDRDDQEVVELNYRILDMAAKYHMVIDYHGMYKPTGLNRTYPNLLNYEGVWGLEQMKWSSEDQMTYDVTFPYIRMMAGPVDYTQGAMRNASTMSQFQPIYYHPMSQGTRAHQVAAYIVFDSPLAMLADSPTAYMKEQETTDYIKDIPTVWDETRVIDGHIGEYIVTARRCGSSWYIGALNGWTPRDLTIDLSVLGPGEHTLCIFKDGINAHRLGSDYRIQSLTTTDSTLTIHLAPGGGFAIKVK